MRSPTRATWPLLTLAVLVTVATQRLRARAEIGPDPAPSSVVFPRQVLPLSFSHVQHLAAEKMDCALCHEDAPGSTSSADNNLPREASCALCHAIERDKPEKQVAKGQPDARCDACHPGWDGKGLPPRAVIPTPNLKFNHKVHAERKIVCQTCHGDLLARGVALATRNDLPRMPLCLACHDGQQASLRCTTCHLAEPGAAAGGRVRTEYAEGVLVPSGVLRGDAHDLRFRTEHQRAAKVDEAYCGNCHVKRFCVECHDGVQKPFDFHGNDYVSLHPIDARRNVPDCSACHRLQTFCTGCHARSGVTKDGGYGHEETRTSEFTRTGNPLHPQGWYTTLAPGERLSANHSFEAQRNIRACVSCHREEFCVKCHSQQTSSVSPHPAGWARSSRCRALAKRAGRMCLRCHLSPTDARCG